MFKNSKICKTKPISFEVFADEPNEMLRQALIINRWGNNVYVKIPVVNSQGKFMGPLIKELSYKKIKLNITAIYSFEQAKKVFKCLNKKADQLFLFLLAEWQTKEKIRYQYLIKVYLW